MIGSSTIHPALDPRGAAFLLALFGQLAATFAEDAPQPEPNETKTREIYKIAADQPQTLELTGRRILIFGPVEEGQKEPALIRFAGEPAHVRRKIVPENCLVFVGEGDEPVQIEFTLWGPATVVVDKMGAKPEEDDLAATSGAIRSAVDTAA